MSLIDDYNKGKIDAVELNNLLHKQEVSHKQGKYIVAIVIFVFSIVGGIIYGFINHKVEVGQQCRDKYPIIVGYDTQADIEAKLDLQSLCRAGKDL